MSHRLEKDLLGEKQVPADQRWGIHTKRALENFPLSGRPVNPALVTGFGFVKLAAIRTLRGLGYWQDEPDKAVAMEAACLEMADGLLTDDVPVDALQGGAGTSTNMCVNEVLANRALEILGDTRGNYDLVSPLDDLNLMQSTNDTFPSALKVAALFHLDKLETELVALQESFQAREHDFAGVVKVGRTQFQDAVLITLGREMGAYAEAINRDRWRLSKARERLRVINLGGTAIGTGLGAERDYIFRVTDELRSLTGLPLARAENLVDATQNVDVFAEVSGLTKTCAVNLLKICNDLRLLSSGPEAGLQEISLPQQQAGSSIMPGKVNPVIPEAVCQAAMKVMGNDVTLTQACASGSLELNPFLPLIGEVLLESLSLMTSAADILRRLCVDGLQANKEHCAKTVDGATALVTALVPALGYEQASKLAAQAMAENCTLRELVIREKVLTAEQFEQMISPEAVCRLGEPPRKKSRKD